MHIGTAMVANQAELTPNGLLNVYGGVWEYVAVPHPLTVVGCIAGVAELEPDEFGKSIRVDLEVHDGHEVLSSGSIVIFWNRKMAPFVVPFAAAVDKPGMLRFTLESSGEILSMIEVPAIAPPSPGPNS